MPLNSPVRLIPAVGVTTGAHYRTLLMFFMFQIYPLVSLREVVSLWEVMRLRRVTAA